MPCLRPLWLPLHIAICWNPVTILIGLSGGQPDAGKVLKSAKLLITTRSRSSCAGVLATKKVHPPGSCQFSELAALFITIRVVYARLSSSITPHPFPLLIVRHFAEAWGLVPVLTVFCFSDFPDGETVALFFCVADQKGERH